MDEERVYEVLEELGIPYEVMHHEAVFTIEESRQKGMTFPAQLCKNLFLRNANGNIHYLLIVDENKQSDLKALARQIGSTRLSFASDERLFNQLKLKAGSVGPFGLINNTDKNVKVLVDSSLASGERICFHPNVNTATVTLHYRDFEKYLKWCGNEIKYVDIPSVVFL